MYLEEKTAKHASVGVTIMRTRERHLIFGILTRQDSFSSPEPVVSTGRLQIKPSGSGDENGQDFLPDRTADGYLLFIFSSNAKYAQGESCILFSRVTLRDFRLLLTRFRRSVII